MPEPIKETNTEVEQDKTTQEVKTTEKEVTAEKTAEEIAKEADKTQKEPETVGLDKFLDEKKGRKTAEKALKDLQDKISSGDSTKTELSGDIADILKEFPDVNPKFLEMLAKLVDSRTGEKLKPITEKERQDNIDRAFQDAFNKSMENLPEFKDIVSSSVIKTLAKDPDNAKKTITQIIEETYGGSIPGRKTIETTKAGGGKEPAPLDYDKARKDGTYFEEVMKNPKLKAEYNAEMLKRGI